MSDLRFRWVSLGIYIKIVSGLHSIDFRLGRKFDYDAGKSWAVNVMSNDLAIKAADIVMYDRHNDANQRLTPFLP